MTSKSHNISTAQSKSGKQSKKLYTNYMLSYKIQTMNLFHNRTHIFIPRTKKDCYHVNRKDAKRDHTDVKNS